MNLSSGPIECSKTVQSRINFNSFIFVFSHLHNINYEIVIFLEQMPVDSVSHLSWGLFSELNCHLSWFFLKQIFQPALEIDFLTGFLENEKSKEGQIGKLLVPSDLSLPQLIVKHISFFIGLIHISNAIKFLSQLEEGIKESPQVLACRQGFLIIVPEEHDVPCLQFAFNLFVFLQGCSRILSVGLRVRSLTVFKLLYV